MAVRLFENDLSIRRTSGGAPTSSNDSNMLLFTLSHVMLGAGTPSAMQVSVTLPGVTTVVVTGPIVMFGGTVEVNYNTIGF